MKQLDHPNIVRFKHVSLLFNPFFGEKRFIWLILYTLLKVCKTRENFYLGMELVKGGSLEELVESRKKHGPSFTDREVSRLIKAVLSALAHMHAKDTMHRDLKPSNILLADRNDFSSVKIIDFGLSEKYVLADDDSSQKGTLFYMAPEVVNNGKITKSVDMWAVGIIIFQLLSGGQHPYGVASIDLKAKFQDKIKNAKVEVLQEFTFLSAISKKFLERLLQVNRVLRYTAADALKHPWITRQKQNRIPLNLVDKLSAMNYEKKLRSKFNLVHFIGIQKLFSISKEQQSFTIKGTDECKPQDNLKRILDEIGSSDYKKKLLFFSKRIDHWHQEQSKINTGVFEEDRDFVELDRSPSKFDMPANQASLDEFLLGNTTATDIQEVTLEEESKEESKIGEQD